MIEPIVGRVVWFYPNQQEERGFRLSKDQPCKADIVYVHNDRLVNVVILSHEGIPVFLSKVKLLQEDDPIPQETERYLAWMPYQKGQAAKVDELKKELADTDADLLGGDDAKRERATA